MSRKKRMFDIELPDEIEAAPVPAKALKRRGPMAAAISENARAREESAAAKEAIRAENDALAHEFVALRAQGNVVQSVPLDQVRTDMLVRDRMPGEDEELAELITSIREVGLSNPIRVLVRPGSGYELVQGYRRLSAYRSLHAETGQDAWIAIPALIMHNEGGVSELYRRMVDENVIRKDLSFAEMAHAARNYAADPETEARDMSEAVAALFQSAPYSKRSYIRSFAALLEQLGDSLSFPTAIPRALGVALSRVLKDDPAQGDVMRAALADAAASQPEQEVDVLRSFVVPEGSETAAAPKRKPKGRPRTKTTFHMQSRAGQVKCMAGPGRLEIKVDRDFSSIDRVRLERAIASLIEGLD